MTPANAISNRIVLECSGRAASSVGILVAACLILVNALLHSQVYGNRNYREDEIVVVHMSLQFSPSELVQYTATDQHPPGWRLLANAWIEVFGTSEEITRWLAKLTNLVTFALVYLLGKHICGKRVGAYAIVLLGVYGFASNAMYELRPYPMLIMLVTALHLLFFRWLHKPSPRLMLCYTGAGIAAIYTHFFSFLVFPAHALCLILFTRYERKLWLNSFLLWIFIGLSFVGWLLPFLHSILVVMPGGIYYAISPGWEGILSLYRETKFKPEIIYHILLFLSPFAPSMAPRYRTICARLRFDSRFIVLYPLVLLMSLILIAFAADTVVRNLSSRNTVMFASTIALCMALALRLFPTYAALILATMLFLHAHENISWQTSNGPYREIVEEMTSSYQENSIVVTEFDWAWRGLLPAAYYLMDFTPDRMSKHRLFHLVEPFDSAHPPNYSDALVNVHYKFSADNLDRQMPNHQQLWHLREGKGNLLGAEFSVWIDRHYAHVRTVAWDEMYRETYLLSEYIRAPSHRGPMLEAGSSLRLYSWHRHEPTELKPCQPVTIESWWKTKEADETPYTISLILAGEDGDGQLAIANTVPADQFTSDWRPDKFYRDLTSLVIPCDIASGQYNLLLAAKESNTGEPLTLKYPDGDEIGIEYYLTTINV